MRTLTDTRAAAALATAAVHADWAAWQWICRTDGRPSIAADLAGAADLLRDVIADVAREAGLPGDERDVARVWAGTWPREAVAEMGLSADEAGTALAWLGGWLDGECWLPAHDQVACLLVAVLLAARLWGQDRAASWPAFLLAREAAWA